MKKVFAVLGLALFSSIVLANNSSISGEYGTPSGVRFPGYSKECRFSGDGYRSH